MKLSLDIKPEFTEELLTIQAPKRTEAIDQIVTFVNQLDKTPALKGKKDNQVYLLQPSIIQRIYIENRRLMAQTDTDDYLLSMRLYQVLETLPQNFIKISQSEIINLKAVRQFAITANGLVEIHLNNGQITYSSRRYLKSLKEQLQ